MRIDVINIKYVTMEMTLCIVKFHSWVALSKTCTISDKYFLKIHNCFSNFLSQIYLFFSTKSAGYQLLWYLWFHFVFHLYMAGTFDVILRENGKKLAQHRTAAKIILAVSSPMILSAPCVTCYVT